MSSSRGSSKPRDQTQVSCFGGFFTIWATREPILSKGEAACPHTAPHPHTPKEPTGREGWGGWPTATSADPKWVGLAQNSLGTKNIFFKGSNSQRYHHEFHQKHRAGSRVRAKPLVSQVKRHQTGQWSRWATCLEGPGRRDAVWPQSTWERAAWGFWPKTPIRAQSSLSQHLSPWMAPWAVSFISPTPLGGFLPRYGNGYSVLILVSC